VGARARVRVRAVWRRYESFKLDYAVLWYCVDLRLL